MDRTCVGHRSQHLRLELRRLARRHQPDEQHVGAPARLRPRSGHRAARADLVVQPGDGARLRALGHLDVLRPAPLDEVVAGRLPRWAPLRLQPVHDRPGQLPRLPQLRGPPADHAAPARRPGRAAPAPCPQRPPARAGGRRPAPHLARGPRDGRPPRLLRPCRHGAPPSRRRPRTDARRRHRARRRRRDAGRTRRLPAVGLLRRAVPRLRSTAPGLCAGRLLRQPAVGALPDGGRQVHPRRARRGPGHGPVVGGASSAPTSASRC